MNRYDLDTPLINILNAETTWTLRNAVEGVQIFGGIGSGKTSGSGRMLALKYLDQGYGGLVLTVKPGEKADWQEYCRLTGRMNDLIILEPGGKYSFNFIEYESTASASNEAITENIVEVLKTVIRAGEQQDTGKNDDQFWEAALDMLIFNVIDLCKMAYGSLSLLKMYDIVLSLPKPKPETSANEKPKETSSSAFLTAYKLARKNLSPKLHAWEETLYPEDLDLLKEDQELYNELAIEAVPEARLLSFLNEFFNNSFKNLSPKTRSIVEFIFTGFLFRLLREPVYSLLCRGSSDVLPEDCLKGKIILVHLPVKKYHKVGRDCQILFKYIWQRAMEKRQVTETSLPVFLWADEAQNFLHEHDADYQATARSSKIATVYITQNLPNYYACMGGHKAEYRVKSFLGTLGTKIFHANADLETNKYSSELIGEGIRDDVSKTVTVGTDSVSQSQSVSLKLDRLVRPEEFMRLKTGGRLNGYWVEGVFHVQGTEIIKGRNHKKMKFSQHFLP